MRDYSDLDHLVAEGRCVVAYLDAFHGMWQTQGDLAAFPDSQDVHFIQLAVKRIRKEVDFDRTRVYAVGMSNGGVFAQLLSFATPCEIAATVSHSAGMPRNAETLFTDSRCKPAVLLLAGENDETGADDWARSTAAQFTELGITNELIIVNGLNHAWDGSQVELIWRFLSKYDRANLVADP